MPDLNQRYRRNGPSVVREIIDGDVVSINLDTGDYYCARDSAARIWCLLEAGEPISEILQHIGEQYNGNAAEIDECVTQFITRLLDEHLMIATDQVNGDVTVDFDASFPAETKQAFRPPVLEKYTDMQDFLLVDPIHEIDVTAWPEVKKR